MQAVSFKTKIEFSKCKMGFDGIKAVDSEEERFRSIL